MKQTKRNQKGKKSQHLQSGRTSRAAQAKKMQEDGLQISQFATDKFRVPSQTTQDKSYVVSRTGHGLVCECPDHKYTHSDCKHIKRVLQVVKKNGGYANNTFRIMDRSSFSLCPYCDSGDIKKNGRHTLKSGEKTQRFKCNDCKKRFQANFGFEGMKNDPKIITRALQMQNSKMSCRRIADCMRMEGIDVSYRAVFDWITKYSKMLERYTDGIIPRTANRFSIRADEIFIRFSGIPHWMYASIEDDSRYWLSYEVGKSKFQHDTDRFIRATYAALGRYPTRFTTDGLPSYGKSARRVLGRHTHHISAIHMSGDMNNNMMERFNEEVRGREKVCWGLKKPDTPVLALYKTYYNFAKSHGGLDGRTPAEAASILVEGRNVWMTLIQNARLFEMAGEV